MKNVFVLFAFVVLWAISLNVYAQQAAPPGAGDKDLADKNIKTRSIDLERVDRDARKTTSPAAANSATPEDRLAAKYAEIKADYEQIQLSQDAVIKAYQGGGKIDYEQISKSAMEINAGAKRLNSNLFPAPPIETAAKNDGNKSDKSKIEAKKAQSVRDLIVNLDNSIGGFAASPMFQNLRIIDAAAAEKAKLDLENIIELSANLNTESKKMVAIVK